MNIILYLSKYDSAFRDYNKKLLKNDSINQEKFILNSNYYPILLVCLENLNNTDKKKTNIYVKKFIKCLLGALTETICYKILQL